MDVTNQHRAQWALAALREFQSQTATDDEDAVADLLSDIMHLCGRNPHGWGWFETNLRRARDNYEAEVEEEHAALASTPTAVPRKGSTHECATCGYRPTFADMVRCPCCGEPWEEKQ